MTDDGVRTIAPPPGRRSSFARARYVPLIILVLCVVAATVVGRVHAASQQDDADRAAAAARAADGKPSLPAVCAPPVDQGIDVEHWRDDEREAATEAVFTQRMADEKPGYVTGRKGWLFFNDVQAKDFSQAVGRERQGRKQVAAWDAYLSRMKREAEARGGRFFVMIAPAKWDVYPGRLPRWAQDVRGTNSLDHLMSEHPDLPFIDVRAPLRAAGADDATYSPLNSHWTDYGGYVAWKAATACLRAAGAGDGEVDVPAVSGVDRVDDLNEFAADGVQLPAEPQWTRPVYRAPHPATTVTDLRTGAKVQPLYGDIIDTTQLPVETRTADAQSSKTLLVFRDSTGNALSPLWSTSFARTVQYQHPIGAMGKPVDLPAVVDEVRPDVTIFTMTERYLSFDPPS